MSASPVLFHPSCSDISNNMEIMEVANGGEMCSISTNFYATAF